MSPFDVVAKLFNASSYNAATVSDKIELYFQDYGLIPLMVQVNGRNISIKLISVFTEFICAGKLR